jgi:allophanate hydrolase
VGARSPYGAVRSAEHPDRISGGSSSGSAVAVALSVADFSLGTDTAGSGRVPAALQGIVGLKASVGLVPTTGVLPACRTLDCVTVFAREFGLASTVLQVIQGADGVDSLAVDLPASAPLAAPENAVIAVPRPEDLAALAPLWRTAFDSHLDRLRAAGHTLVEINITPFLSAAALLYNGAFVAERYAAVGEFIEGNPEGLDPIVAKIVRAAGTLPAHQYASDLVRLADLKAEAERAFAGADAMLLPTTTHHPSLADVAAEPIAVNSRLGTFTNFANLFGYPAFAVPIDSGAEGENVGVQVLARPFADAIARDVALQVLAVEAAEAPASSSPVPSTAAVDPVWADTEWSETDTTPHWTESAPVVLVEPRGFDLLVVGAHLSGLPLHGRLRRHGSLFAGEVRTADGYTLVALGDPLNRPGMVRTSSDAAGSVLGELWRVPETALSALLLEAAAPLGLGRVTLADGREVIGYLCEASAAEGKPVVADGDWRAHVSRAAHG